MATADLVTRGDVVTLPQPLPLDCGRQLDGVQIAYEAYGELNAAKDNVVFIAHALTGDHHVASPHPITG